MESFSPAVIFATIFLSLFLHYPSPANATRMPSNSAPFKLVNEFCNQHHNKTFCLKALKSAPGSASAPDHITLAKIAIDLGIADMTKLQTRLSQVHLTQGTNRATKDAFQNCLFSFAEATDFLKDARKLVWYGKKSYHSASQSLESAFTNTQCCQGVLDSNGVHDASMSNRVQATSGVIQLAYEITYQLDGRSSPT